jgi:hypothetical protein
MPGDLPKAATPGERGRRVALDLRAFVLDGVDPKLAAKLLAVAAELENIALPAEGS